MPSVTDVPQQQASNIHGKSTPPPPQTSNSTDGNQFDAMSQSIQVLEKKLRNLGKRKEKLEGYEQEEKRGKELNKDQKEALAKYPEVIGQIDCVKELIEQLKKIQTDAQKHQKRLGKQMLEEKRLLIQQRMTEYAQIRYLLDHRPNTLKEDESTLLDQLSTLIVPNDNSSSTMTTSVDAVLSIYQGGSVVPKIKSLTGKNLQDIREILEQLVKNSQQQQTTSSSSYDLQQNDEQQIDQTQPTTSTTTTTVVPQQQQPTAAAAEEEEEEETEEEVTATTTTMNEQENVVNRPLQEYPLKFDTREQSIPLEQIMKDSPFLLNEPIQPQQLLQDNHLQHDQYNTILSSNHPEQSSTLISNLDPNDVSPAGQSSLDHQQHEEQWQQTRTNNNNQRNNQQYNQNNRYYHQNRPGNNYYPSGSNRGPRGGRYNNSYVPNQPGSAGGPRPFHDNQNRGRGTPNPNYRGNRGGNYRGGHRGNGTYQGNGNNYPKGQYHSNNDQQQIRSAPPTNSSTGNHQ